MSNNSNPTTILTVHSGDEPVVWIISHPFLGRPLRIDPRRPGSLSRTDQDSYNRAFYQIDHKIWHDLYAALIAQLGLTPRHAECIAESWDSCAAGYDADDVAPFAHA